MPNTTKVTAHRIPETWALGGPGPRLKSGALQRQILKSLKMMPPGNTKSSVRPKQASLLPHLVFVRLSSTRMDRFKQLSIAILEHFALRAHAFPRETRGSYCNTMATRAAEAWWRLAAPEAFQWSARARLTAVGAQHAGG